MRSGVLAPTVLVVEDDPVLAEIMSGLLQVDGLLTFNAMNGETAIRMAQEVQPDLITLDLRLPDLDGHYVLEQIHSSDGLANVPIIVVSGAHYRPAPEDCIVAI